MKTTKKTQVPKAPKVQKTQKVPSILNNVPSEASEMFQIKLYADKPNAFGLFVHSFVSYERIGKWDEDVYYNYEM
ncbi:MAG: hypothetical protein NC417_04370 [Candidatus Gastranaerophilales bacterium]|nr:hypothetical protein [Candidatus Gastranaerophilales bacterium]